MLKVECSGTPFEIGVQHGTTAKVQIGRCIEFYAAMFQRTSKLNWQEVLELAKDFEAKIKDTWVDYYDEIAGIAQGSGFSTLDIIALNVRTEIAFGKFSDGCTALSWHTKEHSFLAQNWDWNVNQRQNLIALKITPLDKPSIHMMTEAGIIGKIGLNSAGVGVCLNAIRAQGMDPTRLPVHLALRMALESQSAREAVEQFTSLGIASPAHMLVADASEAFGCEFTSTTSALLRADERGRIIHSNHLLLEHLGVIDTVWLKDSPFRVQRMMELTSQVEEPTLESLSPLFEDRENAPTAICRTADTQTLFNIIMDLRGRKAVIKLGLPDSPEETFELTLPGES
ncbi:acyl-coenzyme A:6-aminopenicillanic acid acyl-transferase-domain-containing protein [Xylariales sp. PMI_506]|nr:acyl-coenzyme A:6-aminopenicillanic acid acyl-transferase-domain-containing protein [Xylariales sp. PMI_506]